MSISDITKWTTNGRGAAVWRAVMMAAMVAIGATLWDVRDTVQEIRSDVRLQEYRLDRLDGRVTSLETRERDQWRPE